MKSDYYCRGKRIYNKKGAQTSKNARWAEDHVALRIYQCELANHWHLTSKDVYRKPHFIKLNKKHTYENSRIRYKKASR